MDLIIKGFIIGVAKIIPGVSGSMLAIILGIYEQLLSSIAEIKQNFIKNSQFIFKIGIGMIIAMIFMSKIVVNCLTYYYFPTMLLFIGMIVGGIPSIVKKTKFNKKTIFLSLLIIMFFYLTINIKNENITEVNYNIIDFIKLISIGFVDAFSSIVPGISGTALLMTLGYYNLLLETFSTLFDIDKIALNLFVMIPFSLGFIIGTILISKLLNYLFKNYKNKVYICITIFVSLSSLVLIKKTFIVDYSIKELLAGILLFILGYKITNKLEKIEN